jgi:hypothetical protein
MHPQYDRSSLCCAVILLVCLLACMLALILIGVFAIFWSSLLDGLDNALVSLCVWNAVSKYHAPDRALVMFEGLLLLCFISFYCNILHNC